MTLQDHIDQAHHDLSIDLDDETAEPLISLDHYPPPDLPADLRPWWVWVNEEGQGHSLFVLHPEFDPEESAEQWVEESLITVPVNTVRRLGWQAVDGFITINDTESHPEDIDRTAYFSANRYLCEVCREDLPAGKVHAPPHLQWHPECKPNESITLFTQKTPPSIVVDALKIYSGFQELRGPELNHLGDVADLVIEAGVHTQIEPANKKRAAVLGEGQGWITKDRLIAWGVDVDEIVQVRAKEQPALLKDRTAGTPLISDAVAAGWTFENLPKDEDGDQALRSAFTMVRQRGDNDCVRVRIVLIPFIETPDEIASIKRSGDEAPLLADGPDPAAVARRLGLFTIATGFPWLGKGGVTGTEMLKAVHAEGHYDPQNPCNTGVNRARVIQHRRPAPPVEVSLENQTIDWHRELTSSETQRQWVHSYDRNAAYLALIGSQQMPIGRTHELIAPAFDPKRMGFWKVVLPERPNRLLPHPLWTIGGHWSEDRLGEERWLTTPTLFQARKDPWACEPQIIEAVLWDKSIPVFKDWQRHLAAPRRNATGFLGNKTPTMDADARAVQNMTKSCYKIGIGMIGQKSKREGRETYAAEQSWVNRNWHHFIVSRSREGMLITLGKIWEATSRAPIAVKNDSIYFVSDNPDPIAAWPLRQPNGKPDKLHLYQSGWFKHEATAELTDELVDWFADPRSPGKVPIGSHDE